MPAFIWQFRVRSEMPLLAESVLDSRQKAHSEIVLANLSKVSVNRGWVYERKLSVYNYLKGFTKELDGYECNYLILG